MEMKRFLNACEKSSEYPKNVLHHSSHEHNLKTYFKQLNDRADGLFAEENGASLDFLDHEPRNSMLQAACTNFQPTCIRSLDRLKEHLREALREEKSEPICRFIFIHARHSRDPLNISYRMFCFLFTYLQVAPHFLDFLFPFGDEEHARDFYFTGFRENTLLDQSSKGLSLPLLGRSGLETTICFNLRSVERDSKAADLPWSIRQTAIYHMFDFEIGKSLWITVKGNRVMKRRISKLAESLNSSQSQTSANGFKESLKVHMLLCDWAVENWRWYINDLEEKLRDLTRSVLFTTVERPVTPQPLHVVHRTPDTSSPMSPYIQEPIPAISRIGTFSTLFSPSLSSKPSPDDSWRVPRTFSGFTTTRTKTGSIQRTWDHCHGWNETEGRYSFQRILGWLPSLQSRKRRDESINLSIDKLTGPPDLEAGQIHHAQPPPGFYDNKELDSREEFKFSDLQRIQFLEDKTREVALVLQLNMNILRELRQHYEDVWKDPDFPSSIKNECSNEMVRFNKLVCGAERDLGLQRSRTEMLLRSLADNKAFLYGILQYRSMRSSEIFAMKAQQSAKNMEALTNNMNDLAQKTKQETVSMRIITLVTLFFLPGTFIGTFMSTDIVKFDADNQGIFQVQGLRLYMAITVPLMLGTFLAWWIVKKMVDRENESYPARGYIHHSNRV